MQAAPLRSVFLSARSSDMSLWLRRCVRLAHAEHWRTTCMLKTDLLTEELNFPSAFYELRFRLLIYCLASWGIRPLCSTRFDCLTMTHCEALLVFVRPQASPNCAKAIDLLTLPANVRIWLYLNKRTEADITCTCNRSVVSGQSRLWKDKRGFNWYFQLAFYVMSLYCIICRTLDLYLNALQEANIYFCIALTHEIDFFLYCVRILCIRYYKNIDKHCRNWMRHTALIKNCPHVLQVMILKWTLCPQKYQKTLVLWKITDEAWEQDIVPKTRCTWRDQQNSIKLRFNPLTRLACLISLQPFRWQHPHLELSPSRLTIK